MSDSNNSLINCASLALICLLVFSGCSPAKKITPPPRSTPNPQVEPARVRKPAKTVSDLNLLNNRLSTAANKVGDVRRATVAALDTTAYVGLSLKPGLSGQRQMSVKRKAAAAVKTIEPRIVTVWVTLNPESIKLIDAVRADVKAKRPSSKYSRKLRVILDNSQVIR